MAKGSQLAQLKTALSDAGLSRQPSTGKKRKRTGQRQLEKDKKASKLQEIRQKLNPFDLKVTKVKHDVGGRKVKGVVGKPGLSKQAGIENRRRTLLNEYRQRGHSGGIVDRRFGENDPTMTPEERMLERFTKERQRSSRGAAFNLEDEDDLTHYGQSLSKLDDFYGASLDLDVDGDQDSDGKIGHDTVRKTHFGGFDDDEEEDEEAHPRKKSKGEVMSEVIAKSKEHKYQRQLERQQDDTIRHELDQDFESIRALLSKPDLASTGSNMIPLGKLRTEILEPSALKDGMNADDLNYDQQVRELALDKRVKPKDRTKTEEELALEAKEALEKAERKRLKRMMGEDDHSSDDDDQKSGERKKRRNKTGADDLEDDFQEDTQWGTIGKGLDEDMRPDIDDDHDNDGDGYESEEEGNEAEELVSARPISQSKRTPEGHPKELPFTFPCPETHSEFLTIVEDVEDKYVPTVIGRIRALYHPSLAEENKYKLQALTTVLIDYVLHITSAPVPKFTLLLSIVPHLHCLTQLYASKSAQHFMDKLHLMQKNLTRGLSSGAQLPESKTWPGPAELALLQTIGTLWPTSDMNHHVVSPARLLMGAYLSLGRIRCLRDLASGMFLCTLFLQFEQLSKRLVPEAVTFLINAILHLGPHGFRDVKSLPGSFPATELDPNVSKSVHIDKRRSRNLEPQPPDLVELLILPGSATEQMKIDLLGLSFELLGCFADMYKGLEAFIELFQPVLSILERLQLDKCSKALQAKLAIFVDSLRRLMKFSRQSRHPLLLQAHKPIPIASYIPKFESSSSSYLRGHDPDQDRVTASKLRHQYKQERKGAMRELRKDARFLAAVQQKDQQEMDRSHKERMSRVFSSLEIERAEQKRAEKEKLKEKKRAGRK